MWDTVFMIVLLLLPLLLCIVSFREFRATKRVWHLLPIVAYLIAGLGFISGEWLSGMMWTVIGLILRIVLKRFVK
jgi:hypothetical protein